MMFKERFLLSTLSRFHVSRSTSLSGSITCRHHRFFHSITTVDAEMKKPISTSMSFVRHYVEKPNYMKITGGDRGFVKETILRGRAATDIQESLLAEFVKDHDDASSEQWKSLLDKLLEFNHGMIHEANVDGRVLETCHTAQKLPLARSYLNFIKSSGKKFNSVSVCGFIKICHECESAMTEEDKQRVQMFTKYLMTRHQILDSITGDAVVKGLILSGRGEESIQILLEAEKATSFSQSTYAALASYMVKSNQPDKAMEYIRFMMSKGVVNNLKVFIDWIEYYKNDRQKLDELLAFFRDVDLKPSKEICDHLVAAFQKLPRGQSMDGVYGYVKNSGECSVCQRRLERLDLSEKEFNEMRSTFLKSVIVGNDVFQNSTPEELKNFISFVDKNGPYDIILDGLNIAYMSGTSVVPEVFVGLVKGVVQHFRERDNKILLVGRKHMLGWPHFLATLKKFDVQSFFIDNVSEDDLFIIYATLFSGLDAYFVTRDLFRSEKFGLTETQRALFKRWQQSHQIFVTYVAPSGKVYMKTPISFQMMVQKTDTGGWHIPYTEDNSTSISKDEYGIHRKWLCLDSYLS